MSSVPAGSATAPVGTEPPSQPPTTDVISAARQAAQEAAQQTGQSAVTDSLVARGYGLIDSERGRAAYSLVQHANEQVLDALAQRRWLAQRQQADAAFLDEQRQQHLHQQAVLFEEGLRMRANLQIVALSAAGALATAIQSGSQGDATALSGALVQVLDKIAALSPPANVTGSSAAKG